MDHSSWSSSLVNRPLLFPSSTVHFSNCYFTFFPLFLHKVKKGSKACIRIHQHPQSSVWSSIIPNSPSFPYDPIFILSSCIFETSPKKTKTPSKIRHVRLLQQKACFDSLISLIVHGGRELFVKKRFLPWGRKRRKKGLPTDLAVCVSEREWTPAPCIGVQLCVEKGKKGWSTRMNVW